jgi:hypothetical protein
MLEMLPEKFSGTRKKRVQWVIWCRKEKRFFFASIVPPIVPHEQAC